MNTCGPACLMVALHEMGRPGLSRDRELKIWKHVRHFFLLGSTPAYVAEYAKSRGLATALYIDEPTAGRIGGNRRSFFHTLHRHLKRTYRMTARKARDNGLAVRSMNAFGDLAGILSADSALAAICLVYDEYGYLHFVLARRRGETFVVMDPADGSNTGYEPGKFLEQYGNVFAGYVVVLGREEA